MDQVSTGREAWSARRPSQQRAVIVEPSRTRPVDIALVDINARSELLAKFWERSNSAEWPVSSRS
jgi:hypothetical protein